MADTCIADRLKIQSICDKSMKVCKIGEKTEEIQNGLDFYKYFFTNFPDLRVYFKGAQNYTAEDVQKSDRFAKQGQRLLLAMHVCVKIFHDPTVFHSYIRETVNRHRQYKMDPNLWSAFFTVWLGYLEEKMNLPIDEPTKQAWNEFGEEFAAIARKHLEKQGLPF